MLNPKKPFSPCILPHCFKTDRQQCVRLSYLASAQIPRVTTNGSTGSRTSNACPSTNDAISLACLWSLLTFSRRLENMKSRAASPRTRFTIHDDLRELNVLSWLYLRQPIASARASCRADGRLCTGPVYTLPVLTWLA